MFSQHNESYKKLTLNFLSARYANILVVALARHIQWQWLDGIFSETQRRHTVNRNEPLREMALVVKAVFEGDFTDGFCGDEQVTPGLP
jgi:hypothetical protein